MNIIVATPGQNHCKERLLLFSGINPNIAQGTVAPALCDGNAKVLSLQRAPPPDTREDYPYIAHWQHAALCQSNATAMSTSS